MIRFTYNILSFFLLFQILGLNESIAQVKVQVVSQKITESIEWKEGKTQVKVKRGDSYTRIVNVHKTSMDSLVHLSRLQQTEANRLRIGDKLTVMPLEMHVVIDIRRKTLTIWRGGEFIKEYPVMAVSYKEKAAVKRMKIGSVRGEYRGRMYPSHAEEYRGSSKVILLSDKSLAIAP